MTKETSRKFIVAEAPHHTTTTTLFPSATAMGPPRRNPSQASPTSTTSGSESSLSPLAHQPSAVLNPANAGMTPASRYQHNLKVLRRRDPSISSIFDQFSHVCLYHHNGSKWEKLGYEGSMFLYERESYPPYGFYILNRMGMDDHIQRLYPEDNIGAHGSYLIIRSYPEYTDRRLAAVRASHNNAQLDKFSDAYAVPNVEALSANAKGSSKTIGLWMFTTDSREPLIDIFTRLHSYIKRNQPYPQEFRYGPDRPPPPSIPSSSTTNRSQANGSATPATSGAGYITSPESRQAQSQAHNNSQTSTNGNLSELDKLFAKMQPTPLLTAATAATPTQFPTSVQSLFANMGATTGDHRHSASPTTTSSASVNTLSLLDSIFASASASASTSSTSTSTSSLPIHTPTPNSTSTPQVLDQATISALLGFPPSRTASAASTAYSTDTRSHSSSREGDNEDEDDTSDYDRGYGRGTMSDGYSESSTVLDPDAKYDDELQAAGASAGRPLLAEPSLNGHGGRNGNGRINGDVTPRPPMNGFITPPFVRQHRPVSVLEPATATQRHQHHRHTQSQSQHQHQQYQGHPPLGSERALVPFEPDSELWPYPSASASDHHNHNHNNHSAEAANENAQSDDEIIELDFADTSALSDPDAFRARHRASANGHTHVHANGNGLAVGPGPEKEKRVRTKRKQGKKERAAEQAREREEIERSWDVPSLSAGLSSGGMYEEGEGPPSPMSASPCPSPEPVRLRGVNGASVSHGPGRNGVVAKYSGSGTVYPPLGKGQKVVPEAVRDSLVVSAVTAGKVKPSLERNEFVREILTLIHTDKTFVDSLFKEYTSRVG